MVASNWGQRQDRSTPPDVRVSTHFQPLEPVGGGQLNRSGCLGVLRSLMPVDG